MQTVGLRAELPDTAVRQIATESEPAAPDARDTIDRSRDHAARAEAERLLDSFESSMPLAAITVFYVNPAKECEFVEQGLFLIASTSRSAGVNAFQFHKALVNSDCIEYMLYEDWNSRELFRAQWESSHLQRFEDAIRGLTAAPPRRTFYVGWCDYNPTS